jgi:hypothetical protein
VNRALIIHRATGLNAIVRRAQYLDIGVSSRRDGGCIADENTCHDKHEC